MEEGLDLGVDVGAQGVEVEERALDWWGARKGGARIGGEAPIVRVATSIGLRSHMR